MASFWKKFNKTFLTLLLLVGVFFAGCVGLAPNCTASATFTDTQISKDAVFTDNVMFVEYAEDVLVGVDEQGYIYRSTDGTANLVKTGVQVGAIKVAAGWTHNDASMIPSGKYIAYKNGTLVIVSYDGTNTKMYYSTDLGVTWLSNNIGSVGTPLTITSGGGYFVCLTQQPLSIDTLWEERTNFLISSNGIDWEQTSFSSLEVSPDTYLKYNNGYFVKVDSYDYRTIEENIFISISLDCKEWTRILAPKQAYTTDNQLVPCCTIAFLIDSTLYCLQDGALYKTTNFSSNATWQLVQEDFGYYYTIVPYLNGLLGSWADDGIYGVEYLEIDQNGKTDSTNLISNEDYGMTHSDEPYGADIIAIGNEYLCIGFSGQFYYSGRTDHKTAMFSTYKQAEKYSVKFLDWNGNIISSVQVSGGDTVIAPASPTRTGYTFTGWDYDITQPITADTVITAQYEINKCEVLFVDYNGQTIKTLTVEYGGTLSEEDIPVPGERAGYQFTGWNNDTSATIVSDVTFVAQYSAKATLTIKYPGIAGSFGLESQFHKTAITSKSFTYTVGDVIETTEYTTWYNSTILPWINDFETDGDYDYDVKFTGWDTILPTTIMRDTTIEAQTEKLLNIRLEYYSQLRFKAYEQNNVDYYLTFVSHMKIEKLLPSGTVIDVEEFKDPEVDYEIYNASRNVFYNNLEHFEFLGWDKDITAPVTEDCIITAEYNMPTINVKMFDLDGYLFNEVDQPITFMTIEDLQAMQGERDAWDRFCEGVRLFFTLQWGELGATIADQVDFANYIANVSKYHNRNRQILTAYVVVNTDNQDMYGGVFKYGAVKVTGPALKQYGGTARENNMSYWINPIVFSTTAYSLTCTVDYETALGSAIKLTSKITGVIGDVFNWLWDFIKEYWWLIVIVVLAIIFRKPLVAAISALFGLIGKGTKKLANKIKTKSKNSTYKKTSSEYDAVKKESKAKKEK